MTDQNVKDMNNILMKFRVVLVCILCTTFALLNPYWDGFIFYLFTTIWLSGVFLPTQEALCIFGYSFFFSALTGRADGTHYMWCVVMFGVLIRYIYGVIRKKEKIAKYPMVVSIFFYLCSLLPMWNYSHFFGIAMAWMFLGPLYLIYIYRDRLDMIQINKGLFAGLVSSALIGSFLHFVCKIPEYSIIGLSDRLQYFTDNPNNIGFACVLIIAGFIIAILKHRQNWWSGLLLISITIFFGSQSRSKAFLLALFILTITTILILIFKNKRVALIAGVSAIAVFCLVFFCFRSYFDGMLNRFMYSGKVSIESITTDRWEVWKIFLEKQKSHPLNIWLGMGAWAEIFLPNNVNTMLGCHSMYIEFFYYFGILGIINLILLMWSYAHTTQREKGKVKLFVKAEDVLPLLMVFVLGVGEMVIFNRKAPFLIFAILYIFNGSKHIPVESGMLERVKSLKIFKKNQKKKEVK